jgi:tetratricopeptide (TPR) repeat protein
LARRAVLREACAAPQIPPEALAIHEDLCAHFDDGDATPLRAHAATFLAADPDSPEGAFVYLYLGDRYRREAAKDASKWPLAHEAFRHMLDRATPLDSYAYLSLAEATNATGNAEDALRHYGIALRPRRGWGQKKPPWRRASPWGTSG